ncbi:MAG: sugar phosphate isomerase/epimerase, partial [Isosphaeraceae bacterium]
MKLGFVSAIVPEYTLEQVLSFAHKAGFSSVELMCWPPGKAERRYAGVTHIDVTNLSLDAIEKIQDLLAIHQVSISGLGYYPNPLSAERVEAEVAVNHLH